MGMHPVSECQEPKGTYPVVSGTSASESSPPDKNFSSPSFVLTAVYWVDRIESIVKAKAQ